MAKAKYRQASLRPGKILLSTRFSLVEKTVMEAAVDLLFTASMVASPGHMPWLAEDQKKEFEADYRKQFHQAFAHLTYLFSDDGYIFKEHE